MNTAVPASAKQIEDIAQEVHMLTRQATDYASVGDYRRAHAAAERAQGAARRLKELLQARRETTRHMRASLTGSGPGQAGERASVPRNSPPPLRAGNPGSPAAQDDHGIPARTPRPIPPLRRGKFYP